MKAPQTTDSPMLTTAILCALLGLLLLVLNPMIEAAYEYFRSYFGSH